jgi:mannose-6-phosphate isomerase-like protein (cupin superfamily)
MSAMSPLEVILKRFELPDEVRLFEHGRYDIVRMSDLAIGKATLDPGWKWSADVGALTGAATHSKQASIGMVISGHCVVEFTDGRIVDLTAGTLFEIPAEPHDSWVVGDEKYVSLHFLDPEAYAEFSAAFDAAGRRKEKAQ